MQDVWRETTHARFWNQLLNERCDMMIEASASKAPWLRSMRFDNAEVRAYQKRFGEILSARGTSMHKLIAGAWGEIWDNEDDEKQRGAALTKKACL